MPVLPLRLIQDTVAQCEPDTFSRQWVLPFFKPHEEKALEYSASFMSTSHQQQPPAPKRYSPEYLAQRRFMNSHIISSIAIRTQHDRHC